MSVSTEDGVNQVKLQVVLRKRQRKWRHWLEYQGPVRMPTLPESLYWVPHIRRALSLG